METLVHTPRFALLAEAYVYFTVEVRDAQVLDVDPADLPSDWGAAETSRVTQRIGDAWYKSRASLFLRVPSRVVPQEVNYLLNPEHPDFVGLETQGPFPFRFDERLAGE